MNTNQIARPIRRKSIVRSAASAAYKNNAENTIALMKSLAAALSAHGSAQQKDSGNWGFAGDLARVNELLLEAVHAAGGK